LEKLKFSVCHLGQKPLLAFLTSVCVVAVIFSGLAPCVAFGADKDTDKDRVVRQVAENWIQIGTEQYKRGFYSAAEKSFLRAKDYEQYLTSAEREQLEANLAEARNSAIERKAALDIVHNADGLAEQKQLAQAKAHLETIQASEFLTDEERELIRQRLAAIDEQLEQHKAETAEIYSSSVELYRAGELEKAREGFLKIADSELLVTPKGQSPKDYLAKIDQALGQRPQPLRPVPVAPQPEPVVSLEPEPIVPELPQREPLAVELEPEVPEIEAVARIEPPVSRPSGVVVERRATEELSQAGGYVDEIINRRNRKRGHARAVVNDAIARAENYIGHGAYDMAKEEVQKARQIVYEYEVDLGEYLFRQYTSLLGQQAERIAEMEKIEAQQREQEKRVRATDAQREYKERMAIERQKRIDDLIANALNFQKQQRYEESLGQLEILLAIDPLHNEALIMRQTLEDMVSFRKQLEVEKEKSRERVNIMLKTDESAIPYAEEMTHPKNWREIIAKPTRQPEEAIGQDPANAAIERQLDEMVDLVGLSPDMGLSEALVMLGNAVDPPLKMSVNWGDLYNNADIDQMTPINMDPLTGIRLRAALDLLLESVSAGLADLGYIIRDGVITIATQASLPSRQEVRVYDVTILVGRPADYYVSASGTGGGGGGMGGGGMGGGGMGGGGMGGGGMGGGGMGGGGMGGGGMGGGGMGGGYFMEYFAEQEEELDRQTLRDEAAERMTNLVSLIQESVDPESWYDVGGVSTITPYENKKLIVLQTPENHREIVQLLKDMRKSLGHQVAIEARFLVVGENFLEEIGLDVDARLWLGERLGWSEWRMESMEAVVPQPTGLPGSWEFGEVEFPLGSIEAIPSGALLGTFGGTILDTLQASFLIRATQAHRDAESLIAPKVTVLSGESATLQVRRTIRYAIPPSITTAGLGGGYGGAGGVGGVGGGGGGGSQLTQQIYFIPTGPTLNITPTITPDKKHVLLNIVAELWDFLGFDTQTIEAPIPGGVGGQPSEVLEYDISMPITERSRVKTRVSVPDMGTLLLGGLKKSEQVEKEAGVPVLSKIPGIGRLFTNRSKIADQKILLILVKPTIILQEEADAEAIAAMEGTL